MHVRTYRTEKERNKGPSMGAGCKRGLNNPFPAPGADDVHRRFSLGPPSLLLRRHLKKKVLEISEFLFLTEICRFVSVVHVSYPLGWKFNLILTIFSVAYETDMLARPPAHPSFHRTKQTGRSGGRARARWKRGRKSAMKLIQEFKGRLLDWKRRRTRKDEVSWKIITRLLVEKWLAPECVTF